MGAKGSYSNLCRGTVRIKDVQSSRSWSEPLSTGWSTNLWHPANRSPLDPVQSHFSFRERKLVDVLKVVHFEIGDDLPCLTWR